MDHFCQMISLIFAFVRESCRYSVIGAILRPRSTDVWVRWISLVELFFALLVLSLALGLFISTMANTGYGNTHSGMVLILPMIFVRNVVSGGRYARHFTGIVVYRAGSRWYIDAVRRLMIKGIPFADVAASLYSLCHDGCSGELSP